MADAVAIDEAGADQHRHARPQRDGQQGGRLHEHHRGREIAHIDPVDDARQHEPAGKGRHACGADEKSGAASAQQRLGQRQMMGDEADLDGQPSAMPAAMLHSRTGRRPPRCDGRRYRGRHGVPGRRIAIAPKAEIGGTAKPENAADQGQQHQRSRERHRGEPEPQPQALQHLEQQRHPQDRADARAHDGQGHRAALVALEPRRHRGGDARGRERRPADAISTKQG